MPPPTPKRPLKAPAAVPIAASFSVWRERDRAAARTSCGDTRCRVIANLPEGDAALRQRCWRALGAEPERTAILTDIDGTLAAIVQRPEQVAVPEAARAALAELSGASGWSAASPGAVRRRRRRWSASTGIAYAGNHGLELLLPGDRDTAA